MRVTVGAASDIGQVREGNEDSYLVIAPLYAVADGMGGHRGGEVASNLALETVQQLFEQGTGTLAEQVEHANRAVFDRSRQDRSVSGMGTTLTAALIDGDRVHLAHVGDSLAYLFRGGDLSLLTEDHTLVHKMVMEGEITEEEAETHPHRSILTRALGVDAAVQVDESDVEVAHGDRLLLCSDGLTGMVAEDRIREILSRNAEPQSAVDELVKEANQAGGIDNITALILDFVDDGADEESTVAAEIPHAPTQERPIARRSDITIVGAPIPEPPPEASSSAGASPSARSAGPRRSRAMGVATATQERAAPSPTRSPSGSRPPDRRPVSSGRGKKVALWGGVTVAVLVLGVVGGKLYLDRQWFVGVSDGRVAIFRGIPTDVAGVELSSVVVETSIPANEAQLLAPWRSLSEGITADDRAGADAIVEQIRDDVERFEPAST
jgi:serine/threonine protein phosphatase PrpC